MDVTQILLAALAVILTGVCTLSYRTAQATARLAESGPKAIATAVDSLTATNRKLGSTLAQMVLLIGEMRGEHDRAHDAILVDLRGLAKEQGAVSSNVAVLLERTK